jgi:methyl-accepting chemotaxis protein
MNLKLGISAKFLLLSAMMFIGFSLLAGLAAQKIHQTLIDERIDKVRSLSETSLSMVKAAYARYQSGELSEEAAKTLVNDQMRKLRYGRDEYFFVIDYDGVQVMHGVRPEREGKNFYTALDTAGDHFVKA